MDYNPNYPGLSGLLSDNYLSSLKYIGDVKNNIIRIIILIAQSFSEIIIRTIIKKWVYQNYCEVIIFPFWIRMLKTMWQLRLLQKKLIFINWVNILLCGSITHTGVPCVWRPTLSGSLHRDKYVHTSVAVAE